MVTTLCQVNHPTYYKPQLCKHMVSKTVVSIRRMGTFSKFNTFGAVVGNHSMLMIISSLINIFLAQAMAGILF